MRARTMNPRAVAWIFTLPARLRPTRSESGLLLHLRRWSGAALLLLAMAFIVAAAVFFFGLGVSRFFLGSPPSVPFVGFQNRRVHRESRTPLRGSGPMHTCIYHQLRQPARRGAR